MVSTDQSAGSFTDVKAPDFIVAVAPGFVTGICPIHGEKAKFRGRHRIDVSRTTKVPEPTVWQIAAKLKWRWPMSERGGQVAAAPVPALFA
jgi:hypothetical protein